MKGYLYRNGGDSGLRVPARNDGRPRRFGVRNDGRGVRRAWRALLCAAVVLAMCFGGAGAVFAAPQVTGDGSAGVGNGTPVSPEFQFSSTGVDMARDRVLTIYAKNSAKIGDKDEQLEFGETIAANTLPKADKAQVFKLARITLASGKTLGDVKPGNGTYTSGVEVYVQTDKDAGKAVIAFPGPWRRIAGNNIADGAADQKEWPRITTGQTSQTGGDGTFAANANSADLGRFYTASPDPKYPDSADGFYLITDEGNSGWYAAIELPAYTASAVITPSSTDGLASNVNYEVFVYAKITDALKPAFSSYVNILNKAGNTAPTAIQRYGENRWDNLSMWESDALNKGAAVDWTAAMTLNGLKDIGETGGQALLGFGYFDKSAATVQSMKVDAWATTPPTGTYVPYLNITGVDTSNKSMAVARYVDIGVLITRTDSEAKAYVQLASVDTNTAITDNSVTLSPLLTSARLFYGRAQTGFVAFNNQNGFVLRLGSYDSLVPPTNPTTAGQSTLAEAIANAIIDGDGSSDNGNGTSKIDVYGDLGNFASAPIGGSWASLNKGYSTVSEVFDPQSVIKVELAVTIHADTMAGTAFKAGNTDAVNWKPFLYGATLNPSAGLKTNDIATFKPNQIIAQGSVSGGASLSSLWGSDAAKLPNPSYDKYAYISTGAVNAIKIDQDGKPLAGAVFGLQMSSGYAGKLANDGLGGDMQWLTNTDAADFGTSGVKWATVADPAKGNVTNFVSDANGKVTIDGLDPGWYFRLVELEAPTGYKLLNGAATPEVRAATIGWEAQNALDAATATQYNPLITKVINVPELALPNTGGPGLVGLLCLGAALFLASVAIRRKVNRQPLS